ncbi:acyl carrier protein [Streptacidiphilus cavernicola]|uniref:Acyl carrier protein n=1 Tax=Streptacidiphilus cavernicola TaxID=3342716 RepID=A0ABV6VSQ3_9ACTN
MMNEQQVFDRVRDIIVDVKSATSPVDRAQLTRETALEQPPLSMDSLDFVQFVVGVEESFGIIAQDSDFLGLNTIADSVALILGWDSDGSPRFA